MNLFFGQDIGTLEVDELVNDNIKVTSEKKNRSFLEDACNKMT